jgi:light-regulated signal transduction histidine kinase (bacteriophytochrome)
LIDGLLVLNRLSRSEMHRERVDLSEIARSIAMDLKKSDPERNVAFQIEDGLTANGDPRLLHIVLNNLFGNAWKFTSKHPSARIEFGRAEREGKQVLCLRDDGAGFDMAYASKLFGPFQRLHGVHEFDGTGIGLATAQRIIHRHGGKIWAESAIQKGAAFYFTL